MKEVWSGRGRRNGTSWRSHSLIMWMLSLPPIHTCLYTSSMGYCSMYIYDKSNSGRMIEVWSTEGMDAHSSSSSVFVQLHAGLLKCGRLQGDNEGVLD